MCQLAQLRGANVGRRRMHCGRPNSGEAEVVGGNDFLDDFLRQGSPFPEENPCRRRELCQLSQFRRETVRRRTSIYRQPNSGEAEVVGGDSFFWMSSSGREAPSRRRTLAGEESCASYRNSGERLFAGGSCFASGCPPTKPRWSEVIIFLDFLLRRPTPHRSWHRVTAAPNQSTSPSQIEAGFFSSPPLHLLTTVIYCLSKGRGGRFG